MAGVGSQTGGSGGAQAGLGGAETGRLPEGKGFTGGAPFGVAGSFGTGGFAGSIVGPGKGGTDDGPDPPARDYGWLPMLASEPLFSASGYYETSALELSVESYEACPDRPGGFAQAALGTCSAVEWTPIDRDWVGLAWQYPPGNWDGPGLPVAPGATRVSFRARGEHGGEVVTFGVDGATLPNQTLTASWRTYEIDLTGVDYNSYNGPDQGVRVGFFFRLERQNDDSTRRFYVDDVVWVGPKCEQYPPLEPTTACEAPEAGSGGEGGGGDWSADFCQLGGQVMASEKVVRIDDFEDGDQLSDPLPGGRGFWQLQHVPGVETHYPGPCARPAFQWETVEDLNLGWSMLSYGCGFNTQGAGVRLLLRAAAPGCTAPFDAAAYDGVRFRVWSDSLIDDDHVTFQVHTSDTELESEGGNCVEGEPCPSPFSTELIIDGGWTELEVPFGEAHQPWPPYALLDPQRILFLSWGALNHEPSKFRFAIDDVELYRR